MRVWARHSLLWALVLSLLLHALLLVAPGWELPEQTELPPLQAKLIAVPKKPTAPPRPDVSPAAPQVRRPSKATPAPLDTVPVLEAASAVEAASTMASASAVQAVSAPPPAPVVESPVATFEHPKLPRQARLRFLIYKSGDNLLVGEAVHRFEVDDERNYTLSVRMKTLGLVSLFKTYDSEQISSGKLTQRGLRPQKFSESKQTNQGKDAFGATFDWEQRQLTFSSGEMQALPVGTQDLMSALYQVSQLDLGQGKIKVPVTNGRRLEQYEFIVGEETTLSSRMGQLRVLPLRKVRKPGDEGLEIWLALEYRLLPVKFVQIDRAGQMSAEMVIEEIRVAD